MSADAVLVLRCQEDDIEAFDEIVARYKDGIYNYIWRMVSNRDDAEDLTQEVFLRAFTSIKRFRSEANLRTWLYKIANNICIDRYRRMGLERRLFTRLEKDSDDSGCVETMEIPDGTYDPQALYDRTETIDEIYKALDKLPQKLRMAVLLYDLEGLTYEEITEVMDCPMGTVKSRIFKGRMQLRELLAGNKNKKMVTQDKDR